MSKALNHCGYLCADWPSGGCTISLSTPFAGAEIISELIPVPKRERHWAFGVCVKNNNGVGWSVSGQFGNCGHYLAKCLLRTIALEMRKSYCHRNRKIQKRAQAKARAAEEEASRETTQED